jgi:hypothetical protein
MEKGRLTGNFYFKQSYWGLILMVEYDYTHADFMGDESPDRQAWRKATPEDLVALNLKSEVIKRR